MRRFLWLGVGVGPGEEVLLSGVCEQGPALVGSGARVAESPSPAGVPCTASWDAGHRLDFGEAQFAGQAGPVVGFRGGWKTEGGTREFPKCLFTFFFFTFFPLPLLVGLVFHAVLET